MKIVPIFTEKLYSFHYEDELLDEYGRLFDLWNDPKYVLNYAERNRDYLVLLSCEEFAERVMIEAEELEMVLNRYRNNDNVIDVCFQPLHNQEYQPKRLSLQKKKSKYLRLYAIRIEENCFVITGGAIKVTHLMKDHPDTQKELIKMMNCKRYLEQEGVFDTDSFYEII